MSDGRIDVPSPPVLIVRRRRSSVDEEHHGGVWKIAYADFMTAMMAFFLVMWLVNAADKKTITQVAAYFNPVRLTERAPSRKGIEDIREAEHNTPVDAKSKHKKGSEHEKSGAEKTTAADDESETGADLEDDKSAKAASTTFGEAEKESKLFSDPMGVLDKLAEKAKPYDGANKKIGSAAHVDEMAIRDPFDPSQRVGIAKTPVAAESKVPEKAETPAKPPVSKSNAASQPQVSQGKDAKDTKGASVPDAAQTVEREIRMALASGSTEGPSVEVKMAPEGLLVSVVDQANYGMFKIGSAEPRPEVISIMEKVAGVLKSKKGQIVIRGHTDGRQYRRGAYDNWRLSADRAQMTYYMLVRGGIDKERFSAIEGRADRDLRVPGDPGAAQNRRIDILVKEQNP